MTAPKKIPNTSRIPAESLAKYREAKEAIDEWTDQLKASRAEIENALGEDEVGTVGGQTVVTWKRSKVSRLDQGLLKKLYPEILAECTSASEQRRFTLI